MELGREDCGQPLRRNKQASELNQPIVKKLGSVLEEQRSAGRSQDDKCPLKVAETEKRIADFKRNLCDERA